MISSPSVRTTFVRLFSVLLLFLIQAACSSEAPLDLSTPEEHRRELEAWQASRIDGLTEPDSWLTLTGLFWLAQGENTIGSGSSVSVQFPGSEVPEWLGTLLLRGQGSFEFTYAPGLTFGPQNGIADPPTTVSEPVSFRVDSPGGGPLFRWGTLSWHVIERYDEFAIRLRDSAAPALDEFEGIESFPIDADWRIVGRFHPYDPPRDIPIPNVLDVPSTSTSPGYVEFSVGRDEYRLDVTGQPGGRRLFAIFGDATNGGDTYGGGRFLYLDAPVEGDWVIIDFNKAHNPPCVFTPYATCPLPPEQNKLSVPILAGEKMVHGLGH